MNSYNFPNFLDDHKSQLISSDVPEYFWYDLFLKLTEESYDLGDICELKLNEEESSVICEVLRPMMASNGNNIFLIDHAWSFELNEMDNILKTKCQIRDRVAAMVGIDTEEGDVEAVVDAVKNNIWSKLRYYDITTKNPEKRVKVWYMVDEVGNFLKHEEEPAMKIAPFMYAHNGICYSIAWLVKDVTVGDHLSVDMAAHITEPHLRACLSYPWTKTAPSDALLEAEKGRTLCPDFFLSHRSFETDPDLSVPNLGLLSTNTGAPLRVYSDLAYVRRSLTHPGFQIVDEREQADILWLYDHFKAFQELSHTQPRCLINQFPFEVIVTAKDLLAALGSGSEWLPTTFNLKTQLAHFIRYALDAATQAAQEEEQPEADRKRVVCACNCHSQPSWECGVCDEDRLNCHAFKTAVGPVWIVKPWNLARALGIFVTQNLDHILRLVEAYPAEPKIASRYITDPVLFYRSDLGANVKFDIRYIVLVSSVEPLKLYITKVFWLRFANKQFVLDNWSDYEVHFTVMNYRGECELKNIVCEEFVPMFEGQYPDYSWKHVEDKIHACLRSLFEAATSQPDPMRIKPSPQSRGMFAVDLMLEWQYDNNGKPNIRPQICEVNFCPDCSRACQYTPDFFNDVFATLFLDQPTNVHQLV